MLVRQDDGIDNNNPKVQQVVCDSIVGGKEFCKVDGVHIGCLYPDIDLLVSNCGCTRVGIYDAARRAMENFY